MARRFVFLALLACSVSAFAAQPQAVISSASASGNALTIRGANFGDTIGTVSLKGQTLAVTSWSDTQIVAQLPTGFAAGNHLLIVTRAPKNAGNDKDKDTADFIATIGATGPQGPAGPTGPTGPQGPAGPGLASIGGLGGVPCSIGIAPGTVTVQTAPDGTITMRCVLPPPPVPQPFCLDTLTPSDTLANEAFALFSLSGNRAFAPQCGGSVTVACTNGVPQTVYYALNVVSATLLPPTAAGTYPFTLTFSAATITPVPVFSAGINCTVSFDTATFGSATSTATGELVFDSNTVNGVGPINRVRINSVAIQSEGLDTSDLMLGGGFACTLASTFAEAIRHSLVDSIANGFGAGACKRCGSPVFGDCGPLH